MATDLLDLEEDTVIQEHDDPEARKELLDELKAVYRNRRRIKRRNDMLKGCLKEFFRKRKIDHVCKEQDTSSAEIEAAYENKLNNYNKLKLANQKQIEEKRLEEKALEVEKDGMEEKWRKGFGKLKETEEKKAMEVAEMWKKEKRENMMKKLSKLIETQLSAYEIEGEARSAEIKLREQIKAHDSKLKGMDNIAEDIQIYDYERVQADNVRIQTKIDDKISELRKINANNQTCQKKISQLKQKITTLKLRSEILSLSLKSSHETLNMISSYLNTSILTRNKNRQTSSQLIEKCELNLHPTLLKDYEQKHTNLIQMNEQNFQLKANLNELRDKINHLDTLHGGIVEPVEIDEKPERVDFVDRFRLNRSKCNHWSRSKSRSSDDCSTIQSNLSASFNAKKLQLLDISSLEN